MGLSSKEKYAARVTELEALHRELEEGKRPGDGAVIAGLLLEAAGDVLRRKVALGIEASVASGPLAAISQTALRSWGEGAQVLELESKLKRAADHAVEAAIADGPEESKSMEQWASEDLRARDQLESAVVALETLAQTGRSDAHALASHLRVSIGKIDRSARGMVTSLTALNTIRRAEAALLDSEFRSLAWWYTERIGIEDDQLVKILGGQIKGTIPLEFQSAHEEVDQPRRRPVSFDDLLRFDLGLSSAAEKKAIALQAEADPELRLSLSAMRVADEVIDDATESKDAGSNVLPPTPDRIIPSVVAERAEVRVLLFRSKQHLRVVVQPKRGDRLAAAALYRSDVPDRPFPSSPGELGLQFDLGDPQPLIGLLARIVVRLIDGQAHDFEFRL